ncbi:branched-chain amino acid ABC transporter permease [Aristophania vespae]|uniref:Branched-chain amino acid ABC transporter permease n=1 Tax=Aristophania vespae TaxID=2697033 RepID=A0A6P1NFM4_9PROT|nr:AzlC family ABC transporter permease [Aristophania vespae]QHI95707.1 branched-chain amino acid ABC transporter permease [Aristophania vespae]UMM63400.1 Inner membrane protein YgaZ [Aristophania vespae]
MSVNAPSEIKPLTPFADFKKGAIACLPTILGYWCIGFAAGAIGIVSGFSFFAVMALSVFLYSASAQFIFYSLWVAGAESLSIIGAVLLINVRYVLMSSYLARSCQNLSLLKRFIHGCLLTDETFGITIQEIRKSHEVRFWWLLGLNLAAYLNWSVACLIGTIFGKLLPDHLSQGLMFSLTAMFVGLLTLNYFGSIHKKYELMAICLSCCIFGLSFMYFNANISLILAAIVATSITSFFFTIRTKENSKL